MCSNKIKKQLIELVNGIDENKIVKYGYSLDFKHGSLLSMIEHCLNLGQKDKQITIEEELIANGWNQITNYIYEKNGVCLSYKTTYETKKWIIENKNDTFILYKEHGYTYEVLMKAVELLKVT